MKLILQLFVLILLLFLLFKFIRFIFRQLHAITDWLNKAFRIGKSIAWGYALISIAYQIVFQVVLYFEENRNPDGSSVLMSNLMDYYVGRIFSWPIDLIILISKIIVMTIAWIAFDMGPSRFVVIPLIVVFILWRILGTKKKNFIGKLPSPNESEPPPIKPE